MPFKPARSSSCKVFEFASRPFDTRLHLTLDALSRRKDSMTRSLRRRVSPPQKQKLKGCI